MRLDRLFQTCLGIAFAIACIGGLAHAFSVGPGFQWLSNYELVRVADDIVLAKAVGQAGEEDYLVRFDVIQALKEQYKVRQIVGMGTVDPRFYRGAGDPADLSRGRPGTYAGAGIAHDFQIGKLYLLFLKKAPKSQWGQSEVSRPQTDGDRVWMVGVHRLGRDVEEVTGLDDPWFKVVSIYLKIAKLNDYEKEKAALREVARSARNPAETARYPSGLADDIDRHFQNISWLKSYEDLLALYKQDEATGEGQRAIFAMARARHPQALDLVWSLALKDKYADYFVDYFVEVKHPKRISALLEVFPLVQREEERRTALQAILSAEPATDPDRILALAEGIAPDSPSARLWGQWVVVHPTEKAVATLKAKVGQDYREKWMMAESLAILGDEDILRWAIANVTTKEYLLPVYCIGFSPTEKGMEAAIAIIKSGDSERIQILRYALDSEESRNPNREALKALLPPKATRSQK